ncbi:hypothetical protein U1P98_14680 [Lysinibacillus irui]|uniref:DUF4367 domain-containing protein n=1 Tax=Lysinibacillus irui TaxID=2998077 RepID=A0ABU5NNC3_9BACI|nr:hypothetical protein [Lysinibacillus irui]MEA0552419.1 hypothetical protein [Lysinibacillus irui]MEA0977552.1 hypothetical protein [Lysinibacillus irui]MEA1043706.1 hypothetical protein [Lysinibacillus irui]
MDKHTMHILKDVTAHKEAIIQNVRQQIQQQTHPSKTKWTYRAVTMLITCSLLLFIAWQATQPMNQLATEVTDEGEVPTFTELFQTVVDGTATTYSQYFQIADSLNHRENIKYYAPLQGFGAMQEVASTMGDAVHLIEPKDLPFQANIQEVYAVTSDMKDGSLQTQFQFSFKEKSLAGVDLQYIHFTITNVERNPLANRKLTENIENIEGSNLKNVGFNFLNPLYYREMTPDRGFAYIYYDYDEADKRVFRMTTTSANEFYTYDNGYVYHIGYRINGDQEEVQEKMVAIVRKFISGN